MFAVNVNGIFLMSKAVLPVMLAQSRSGSDRKGYGRICNIASISGKEGNAGMLAYSSSKAAVCGLVIVVVVVVEVRGGSFCDVSMHALQVIGLTKVMGKDYADTGITVNAIAPAVVRTAMVDALPESQVVWTAHVPICSVMLLLVHRLCCVQAYMTAKIPMGRTGEISEIVALVAYVISPEASFTTAFTFDASGGRATY